MGREFVAEGDFSTFEHNGRSDQDLLRLQSFEQAVKVGANHAGGIDDGLADDQSVDVCLVFDVGLLDGGNGELGNAEGHGTVIPEHGQ